MKRVKRRYLALKVESESVPTEREFIDAIWGSVTRLYGEVGASQTGLCLIDFNVEKKVGVVRTSLSSLGMVRSSVATVTSLAGKAASLQVLTISGTLKSLFSSIK